MNSYVVPIKREVDGTANPSDADHIRGVKYANLLFGTDYGEGDVVEMFYLDRVGDRFFQRAESDQPELIDSALYRQFKRDVSEGQGIVSLATEDISRIPSEFDRDPMRSPEEGQ